MRLQRTIHILIIILSFGIYGCDSGTTSKSCGDGILDLGEQCDTDNLDGESCSTFGYYGGELACSDSCTFNTNPCEVYGWCGDGTLQDNEECDGDVSDTTCANEGFDAGTISCSDTCQYDITGCYNIGDYCGNGLIDTDKGETCDGTNLGNLSCADLAFPYHGSGLLCDSSCHLDTSGCESNGYCGDGEIQSTYGEICDLGNLNNQTCTDLGYLSGELSCAEGCDWDLTGCDSCGDGITQPELGEECDGSSFITTCADQGLWGFASCDDTCRSPGLSLCNDTLRFGTPSYDDVKSVVTDGNDLYVAVSVGEAYALDATEAGTLVARLDIEGNVQWMHQFNVVAGVKSMIAYQLAPDTLTLFARSNAQLSVLKKITLEKATGNVLAEENIQMPQLVTLKEMYCPEGGGAPKCVLAGELNDIHFNPERWFALYYDLNTNTTEIIAGDTTAPYNVTAVAMNYTLGIMVAGTKHNSNEIWVSYAVVGDATATKTEQSLYTGSSTYPNSAKIENILDRAVGGFTLWGTVDGTPVGGTLNLDYVVVRCTLTGTPHQLNECTTTTLPGDQYSESGMGIWYGHDFGLNSTILIVGGMEKSMVGSQTVHRVYELNTSNDLTLLYERDMAWSDYYDFSITTDGTLIFFGSSEGGSDDDVSEVGFDGVMSRSTTTHPYNP